MEPTLRSDVPRSAVLAGFVDVIRSVLHIRPDSPVAEPHAAETWTDTDGYGWTWTTPRGQWTVRAGAVLDPRPVMYGPAGHWQVEQHDAHTAEHVVLLLRLAGALPPAAGVNHGPARRPAGPAPRIFEPPPGPDPAPAPARPRPGVVHGVTYENPGPPPPLQPVFWRPGTDPHPHAPAGTIPIGLFDTRRYDGTQGLLLPDGTVSHVQLGSPALIPATVDGKFCIVEIPAGLPPTLLTGQPDLHQALAAHRAVSAAPSGPDAAPLDDDPAVARARAAEIAAGVALPATLPDEMQPAATWGQPIPVPARLLNDDARGEAPAGLGVPADIGDRLERAWQAGGFLATRPQTDDLHRATGVAAPPPASYEPPPPAHVPPFDPPTSSADSSGGQ